MMTPARILPLFLALACLSQAACETEVEIEPKIRIGGNSPTGFYAGATAVTITPVIREYFTDLDFASDTTGFSDHLSPDGWYNGILNSPKGSPTEGVEGFYDANGNGVFEPVWLAGSFTGRPANEVHDDLWARAIVMRSGGSTIAFVSIDAIGYFNEEIRKIFSEVAQRVELEHLVVSASHSHETPDLLGIYGADEVASGWDPDYREFVRARVVEAVIAAAENAVPVMMAVTSGSIVSPGSAMKVGNMHFDARDPVAIDDNIGVFQLKSRPDGKTVATLVNWAGHPEHMIEDNYISSDYVHYLRDRLEQTYPESVALFVNGVLGGQIGTNHADVIGHGERFTGKADKKCREEFHPYQVSKLIADSRCPPGFQIGDREWMWRKAEAVGLNVADRAIELLSEADLAESPRIDVATRDVFLPVDNDGFRIMFFMQTLMPRPLFKDAAGAQLGDVAEYNVNLRWFVRTDVKRVDFHTQEGTLLQILTIPGEMHPELSVGGWDGSKTGGIQPLVSPTNPNPPYPRLSDTACANPPCWDTSSAPAGPFLREKMKGKHNFLFGLTQDELGYIVPPFNWKLDKSAPYIAEAPGDHYEETNSLGPETADRLMAVYDDLLRD